MASTDWSTNPSPYDESISDAEKKYGLPPGFLRKQLILESSLNPHALSGARNSHAAGIAQMQPATAKALGVDPLDPHAAIEAAAKYDADLHRQFGSWGKALVAYHDGPTAVAQGSISPEALQLHQRFQKLPDFQGGASAQSDEDPFSETDAAHQAAMQSQGAGDPFADTDAAYRSTVGEAATPAPQAPSAEDAARQTYDAMPWYQRMLVSSGQGLEDAYRGAQGVGADIVQGVGNLVGSQPLQQAGQNARNQLAAQEAQVAPARAGEHGLTDVAGQALPYLLTAPVGGAAEGAASLGGRLAAGVGRNVLLGAAQGATQPTGASELGQDVQERIANAGRGAAIGGALGAGGELVGTAAGRTAKAVQNRLAAARGGPERTAASAINNLLPDGLGAVDTSAAQRVPGYTPSLAEATQDPRISELDRQLRTYDDAYRAKAEATDANNADAVRNVVHGLRGDRTVLAKAYEDRAQQTAPLYDQAAQIAQQQGARVDTTPVLNTLAKIYRSREGQTSVTNALGQYARVGSLFDRVDPVTGKPVLTSNIQRLANVRNQLSTDIGKQFATDSAGNDMKAAAGPLMELRDSIDDQLAKANPALAEARAKFSELSQPINRMEALQDILPPEKDNKALTASQITSALARLEKARAASGATPAKSLTGEHMQALYDLRDVLHRREGALKARSGADVRQSVTDTLRSLGDESAAAHLLRTGTGAALGAGAGFLVPGVGHAVGSTTGSALGAALANSLSRSSSAKGAAVRQAMANYLLDAAGGTVPRVSPLRYSRTKAGQDALNALTGAGSANLTRTTP